MTKQEFVRSLAAYPGVTWDEQSLDALNIQIDAPHGKVFAANGCHTIVEPFANNGGQSWKPVAYAEVVRRLQHGFYDCEENCEVCEER